MGVYVYDENTGEIAEGYQVISPLRQEANKQWKKRKEQEEYKRLARENNSKLGNYIFSALDIDNSFSDIKPESATRLIYLATYLDYSHQLQLTQRKTMTKADAEEVLKLSKSTFNRFWKEVTEQGYLEETDAGIRVCKAFFRGKITAKNYKECMMQIYIDAMRTLYNSTPTNKHCYLGYVFGLLPYVNVKYNILCLNPFEDELDDIEPITLNDFCELIKYDPNQRGRLKRIYNNICFERDGKMQKFCSFVVPDDDVSRMRIVINPRILYMGDNWNYVDVLGTFFNS